jgi:hypothetical protein
MIQDFPSQTPETKTGEERELFPRRLLSAV